MLGENHQILLDMGHERRLIVDPELRVRVMYGYSHTSEDKTVTATALSTNTDRIS